MISLTRLLAESQRRRACLGRPSVEDDPEYGGEQVEMATGLTLPSDAQEAR